MLLTTLKFVKIRAYTSVLIYRVNYREAKKDIIGASYGLCSLVDHDCYLSSLLSFSELSLY